ncbi:MAG: class I SAM-dependent RNA methyltransferase [Verrucomicrobiae bacterium]|nr:class I SAM-dependent RNA methyltransferase [Verrucomicrobiae bacterium]
METAEQTPARSGGPVCRRGERLRLTIQDIAFGGEGVGRVGDFVVFVPFVAPGEVVEAEVIEVKKSFARARLMRVLEASPERVEPACRHFGACGGCQYQHLAYAAQLRIKRKQVADLFERIGGLRADVIGPVVACPQPYGYRNRIMVRSQWNKPEQRLNIGFLRWDCGLVEDIEECKIADPLLNEQLRGVRARPPPRGGLKVVLRVQPEGWAVPPDSFFQTNSVMLPKLVEVVGEFLRGAVAAGRAASPDARWQLVDLYCGGGFFALELAGAVDRYVGVEYDQRAIRAARQNAVARGRLNGEFIAGRVEEVLPELARRFDPRRTTVLLDPPRKGCAPEAVRLLRQVRPAQVIYVSCHPATMARDLNVLCADGVFEAVSVVPLDMFPQTQHIECVADLRLRAAT